MARRQYQAGCLFKRGKRRKVWVARWREDVLGTNGEKRTVQRATVVGSVEDLPTKRDARLRLEEQLRPINQGVSRPTIDMTFGYFVEEQWRVLVLPSFKRATQRGYDRVLSKHLLPYWRDWRLRDIGRFHVQQFVAEQFKQQRAWNSVRNVWVVLSSVLETALGYGYVAVNPARGVKFPPQAPRKAPPVIAGEDFGRLLEHLREPYRTMVALIAATGLRVGELLALRWDAVDLATGTLAVRESVFEGVLQRPKTPKAIRTIPLGPQAVALLNAHRARVTRTGPQDLVFANRDGAPRRETRILRRVLYPAAAKAGLGRVTWHQFRHIHSSLLNDLRVPVKIAQEQLGHASISTTLNIYTHVIETSHRRAIEALEGVLFPRVLKLAASVDAPEGELLDLPVT